MLVYRCYKILEARLAFVRKDRKFHCLIVGLARNPKLFAVFVRLHTYVRVLRVFGRVAAEQMRAANGPEHLAIAEALRGGGPEAVKRAIRLHVTNGLARARERMEAVGSLSPAGRGAG